MESSEIFLEAIGDIIDLRVHSIDQYFIFLGRNQTCHIKLGFEYLPTDKLFTRTSKHCLYIQAFASHLETYSQGLIGV